MSDWLIRELEQLLTRVRQEGARQRAQTRYRLVLARARSYLADHPDASANAVQAALGCRRADALKAVRTLRQPRQPASAAANRFPAGRNHPNTAGGERA